MIMQLLEAVIGTVAFSILFGVPRQYYPLCGLTGAAGWFVYMLISAENISETAAIFVATVLVIILSRLFAVRKKCPVTVFLISGIFPLVPGARIYWAAYYLVTDQVELAVQSGFDALKAAVAIVLGIVVVFEIPQKLFRIGMK